MDLISTFIKHWIHYFCYYFKWLANFNYWIGTRHSVILAEIFVCPFRSKFEERQHHIRNREHIATHWSHTISEKIFHVSDEAQFRMPSLVRVMTEKRVIAWLQF